MSVKRMMFCVISFFYCLFVYLFLSIFLYLVSFLFFFLLICLTVFFSFPFTLFFCVYVCIVYVLMCVYVCAYGHTCERLCIHYYICMCVNSIHKSTFSSTSLHSNHIMLSLTPANATNKLNKDSTRAISYKNSKVSHRKVFFKFIFF